jgi:small subunit ribosomal protein S13
MIRLLGINLPSKQKIYLALTLIYGIGNSTSLKILNSLNINPNLKTNELSEKELTLIRDFLESQESNLEGALKRQKITNIKRLIEINSIRGRRHLKNLPVRGQRTRTNSRTCRKMPKITK